MSKSITDNRKRKRAGRPRVDAVLIGVRVPPPGLAEIDTWIKRNGPELSRPEAIRQLVELGLTVKARPKQASRARAETASAMASDQLDQLADRSASKDEQVNRKRRLLKGPEEFRGVRVDRPKANGK
jgi:hypothetical protein